MWRDFPLGGSRSLMVEKSGVESGFIVLLCLVCELPAVLRHISVYNTDFNKAAGFILRFV